MIQEIEVVTELPAEIAESPQILRTLNDVEFDYENGHYNEHIHSGSHIVHNALSGYQFPINNLSVGDMFFYIPLNRAFWFDGTEWRNCEGLSYGRNFGETEDRPILKPDDYGYEYYDLGLDRLIIWNGTEWTIPVGESSEDTCSRCCKDVSFPLLGMEDAETPEYMLPADKVSFNKDLEYRDNSIGKVLSDLLNDGSLVKTHEVTYELLKLLVGSNSLIPGSWYRMVDYEFTFNDLYDGEVSSANRLFDILLFATNTNELCEEAYIANKVLNAEIECIYLQYQDEIDYEQPYIFSGEIEVDGQNFCKWARTDSDFINNLDILKRDEILTSSKTEIPAQIGRFCEVYSSDGAYAYAQTFQENVAAVKLVTGELILVDYIQELEKYTIRYTLNNIGWSAFNGKGTITYMKDNHGNICGYDSINLLYKVWKHQTLNLYVPWVLTYSDDVMTKYVPTFGEDCYDNNIYTNYEDLPYIVFADECNSNILINQMALYISFGSESSYNTMQGLTYRLSVLLGTCNNFNGYTSVVDIKYIAQSTISDLLSSQINHISFSTIYSGTVIKDSGMKLSFLRCVIQNGVNITLISGLSKCTISNSVLTPANYTSFPASRYTNVQLGCVTNGNSTIAWNPADLAYELGLEIE